MSSRETVVNRALSGSEYKEILRADFSRLLDNEQLLSPHIAFGRVSHRLTLTIHVDNPFVPDSTIHQDSKATRDANGEFSSPVESFPLTSPSEANELGATELTRSITSPNAERLREGMPVPVHVKQQDGTTILDHIQYPKDAFPDLPAGEVMLNDITEAARQQYKIVEPETQP
jgi:hypothetical protein